MTKHMMAPVKGAERRDVGGVALERIPTTIGAAERLGQHGIRSLILGRVITLVAIIVQAHERTVDASRTAERTLL